MSPGANRGSGLQPPSSGQNSSGNSISYGGEKSTWILIQFFLQE